MRKRLAYWKRSYLSKGRRVTLIRSTQASMPILPNVSHKMPKVVVNRLEKIQRGGIFYGEGEP